MSLDGYIADKETFVVSTTLDGAEHPNVTTVANDVEAFVADLKTRDGKDIWLFGGGVLFRSLLEAGGRGHGGASIGVGGTGAFAVSSGR